MKLLIVHPWAGLPGRQSLYAKLQHKTAWRVRLLTTSEWIDDYGRTVRPVVAPDFEGELRSVPVGLRGNIPLHFFRRSLRAQLEDFEPDCIYVYHEPYAVATYQIVRANKRWRDVPIGVRSSQNIPKVYPRPFRYMESYVYEHSDFCIVVSTSVANVLREKGYDKPIHVVPMAVDTEAFTALGQQATPVAGPLNIGFVGRLVPEKGLDTVLRALALLSEGAVRLHVFGDGPESPPLRELARELGVRNAVEWNGFRPHTAMREAYQRFDALVVPSRTTARWAEQFGRVVTEAAAVGVPAVVSDSGELPILVGQMNAGWSFPEGDAIELARVFGSLKDDRKAVATVGAQARTYVQAHLSEEAIATQLARVIGEACGSE